MPRRPDVKPRKRPRQRRARETERAILIAAERVLVEEGPAAFNTNRVAERAGVSIGSLYQYFPNKAAILFRLHVVENATTFAAVSAALDREGASAALRLRGAIRVFFETERAEAPLRTALELASAFDRDGSHYREVEQRGVDLVRRFLDDVRPAKRREPGHEARFVYLTVTSLAEAASVRARGPRALRRYADDCADMMARHLGLE